ncbi:MAG: hypothetical protein Fur005_00760 [Roseiflexaceae bacterium]
MVGHNFFQPRRVGSAAKGAADFTTLMRAVAQAPDLRSTVQALRIIGSSWDDRYGRFDLLIGEEWAVVDRFSTAVHPLVACTLAEAIEELGLLGLNSTVHPIEDAGNMFGFLIWSQERSRLPGGLHSTLEQLAILFGIRISRDRMEHIAQTRAQQVALLEQQVQHADNLVVRATLAAGAAHDIGNVLTSIVGYTQLLQQRATPNQQDELRIIEHAAQDGSLMLRRVLSGQLPVKHYRSDYTTPIDAVVADVVQMSKPFWAGHNPPIQVETNFLATPMVAIPATELRAVLLNLTLNAITAMQSGGVLCISTDLYDQFAVIQITDTGCGIEPWVMERLFKPAVTTRADGFGLGLSACRSTIESFGGSISVQSTVGSGTTFVIALPIYHPHSES